MNRMRIDEIIEATGGSLADSCGETEISGVRHDSRECRAGDMFVAIIGDNQDGHKYIPQAFENGCKTVLASHMDGWYERIEGRGKMNVIMVEDTVFSMGQLAGYYLDSLDAIRIAVTGSVGKTSVRDMIYYVLSEKYRCGRNLKNYNNSVGLPVSIFRFDGDTEAVVLEMGMDDFGEIKRLSEIVRPHIGVITNIGVSHIEKLGSREGIFEAKMELAKNILPAADGGALVFARDEEFLNGERTRGDYKQLSVGTDGRSDYIISDVDDLGLEGIKFSLEREREIKRISLPVPGMHNASNAAMAIAAGELAGVGIDAAQRGLNKLNLTGSRLKKVKGKSVTLIDDSYNANPDSMKSALKVLQKTPCAGRRIAILGDMFELGENSGKLHFGVGMFARSCDIDRLVAIGDNARDIAEGAAGGDMEVRYFRTKEDFYAEIKKIIGRGDMVLVKGSRGMKMEDVVERTAEL